MCTTCSQNGLTSCNCSDDCPNQTSDLTFDGTLNNITVPAGSSLNDVLVLLESYVNNTVNDVTTTYTISSANCLGLALGEYSYNQILAALIIKVCELASSTEVVADTDDIDLSPSIVVPSCFSAYTFTDTTSVLNALLEVMCITNTGVVLPDTDPYDTLDWSTNSAYALLKDALKGLVDNNTYVYEHTTVITSPTLLNITVKPIKAVIDYSPVRTVEDTIMALTPTKDIYITLSDRGAVAKIEQTIGDPAPSIVSTKVLLYKIVTDGSGVVSYSEEFETSPFTAPALSIPNSYITNAMLTNNTIKSEKLEDAITAATKGDASVLSITYNIKGLITSVTSNMLITGVADGQILAYDLGQAGFVNVTPMSNGTNGFIPLGSGGDLVASAISESATHNAITKKVEINAGAAVEDANAGLNVVTGTFILPRYTAAAASALAGVVDGTTIYVSTTDATFLTVGVWCMIATVWTKLHT